MDLRNLSDGKTDGFVLFYLGKEKLHSVLLTKDQATMLDIVLKTVFAEEKARVIVCDEAVIKGML